MQLHAISWKLRPTPWQAERGAQELEDLKSEIRRYNKLTKEEAKTFQKEQIRIWHPDKRAGMDHTQEEREHAVHMFNVAMGKNMQKMAMDNK